MDSIQNNWIRRHATSFVSCCPDTPLTKLERSAVDRMAGDAQVLAIGEATHGSKEIIESTQRVLRYLIQERLATIVVLEACFAATQPLNRYVTRADGTAHEAVVATGFWSCANHATLGFVNWLRDHNRPLSTADRLVRIFGCDVQSIDGPKSELTRMLQDYGRIRRLPPQSVVEIEVLLAALPTDRDLFHFLDLIMREADSTRPDETRIAAIVAEQTETAAIWQKSLETVSRRLQEMQQDLSATVPDDELFVFQRCRRLLEQVIAFYSPGGLEKRDTFMAENVNAIRQHFQPVRLLVLSHNLHVARIPMTIRGQPFLPMGCLLDRQLGSKYRAIGSTFYTGTYLAAAGDHPDQDQVAVAHRPRPEAFESILRRIADDRQSPGLLVELGGQAAQERGFPWHEGLEARIGESGDPGDYNASFMRQSPDLQYDGMMFLRETSPITVLPLYYQHAKLKWRRGDADAGQ